MSQLWRRGLGTHLEPTDPREQSSHSGQGNLAVQSSLRGQERHQKATNCPQNTLLEKAGKGFATQQFLQHPSRPCKHRPRLGGLGKDPLRQLRFHQRPPATEPAASTASAAAAPSTENALPEYKFLPLSAFPTPSSSLPPFISVRFRQRRLPGEFGNQQAASFASCLSLPSTEQPGAHGASPQTREAQPTALVRAGAASLAGMGTDPLIIRGLWMPPCY